MILGLSVGAYTMLHVAISLLGIVAGFVVVALMILGRMARAVTALFLAASVLTDITGYLFHSKSFGPPHVVGAISLVVLAIGLFALYGRQLAGAWRGTWVVCAVIGLYLNVFVGEVQAFGKLPALHALAPNGSEPPFVVAQGLTLVLFVVLGIAAFRRFKPAPAP
ncbi:MAG TPA: hypothetical protein VN814_10280 [Caulobacteraceae bacterium]|nr:hypothetical protein [Caulobacteraceae bacterium]